jgi:hypothetical protein
LPGTPLGFVRVEETGFFDPFLPVS